MSTPVLYGIKNCDTVKRARSWLDSHGVEYRFHDFKKDGVPADHLQRWVKARGWEAVLNRQGTTWRKLDDATKAGVADAASAMAVMSLHSSVIKRPVVEWTDDAVTVGFSDESFSEHRKSAK